MMDVTHGEIINRLNEHRRYFELGETKDVDFRINQLKKLKRALKNNEKLLLEALYKDLHKTAFEAYVTEVGYLYDSIDFSIKKLRKWARPKRVRTPLIYFGSKSYIYPEPLGIVLIIGAFNYPLQLVIEPLLGAIAAGNCAIIKPSEISINTAKVVGEIIKETFSEAYISIVQGNKEVTKTIINNNVDYIFFTGSARVGKIILGEAAKSLTPATLELGGKSPCIVTETAKLEIAAERIVWGKFLNAGQTCVAPDYIFAHKTIKKELMALLSRKIEEFYGTNPKQSKDYGRIINEAHVHRLSSLINEERVFVGGDVDLANLYIAPTILENILFEDRIMEEEIFGPILPIIEYQDITDVIDKIKTKHKPLALYLFTEDKRLEEKIIGSISFGGGCVNDTLNHLVSPFLPFGGVGYSGMGAYHGEKSFETFSHMKSILKRSTTFNPNVIFPPYSSEKLKLLKRIMK